MLRSKAFTRLVGRQTTSASRLNRATRERDGGGTEAISSGAETSGWSDALVFTVRPCGRP